MNYLRAQNDAFDNRARILIDSTLAYNLSGKPEERINIQIRVYDLDDPHAATIRSKIQKLPADAHFILLTPRR
jgi:5-methylcytosine-specific restriction endonuclease McrBC regulatory subunit McrC